MQSLGQASELKRLGRFAEALGVLARSEVTPADRQDADVLKADLLEQVGRYAQARALAHTLLRSRTLSPSQRSTCEFVLARIDREDGKLESSIARLHRSVALAVQGKDPVRACWSQLRLLLLLAESSGPETVPAFLREIRSSIRKLGHPQLTAALHIFVGEMEAKRGLHRNAERHTRLGLQLLSHDPSVWLETVAEITTVALALMRSDFDGGLAHAARALRLAEESGRAAALRASLANLGNLMYSAGRFGEAIDYYERAMSALPSSGDNCNGALDGIARVLLIQGQVSEASELLERVTGSVRGPNDHRLYVYRHAQLTRTQLLAHQRRWDDALVSAGSLVELASDAGDHLLGQIALLTRAELLQQAGDVREAMKILDVVVETLAQQPPDLYGQYERMLACSLATDGDRDAGTRHLERARRVYQSIRSAPGLAELSRRWDEATAQRGHVAPRDATQPITHDGTAAARNVLQTVAALLRHHGRPELVAREIVHLLGETGCVVDARALSIGADGHAEILAAGRAEPDRGADAPTPPQPGCRAEDSGTHRRLSIGFLRERAVEVELDVRPEIEAQATVHAVRLLLATVQDLERARAEREERISLWPADDDPAELGHAVVRGQMRELMSDARRIANTNVSAFITGESGTGKEILARALHNFSDRAEKPFIPFNCTAVPRDILDSQLFGHRRGSFTGAERDHAGMIGAAQGGTLFLDEVGELGLDLQPKLLRFLESSEICPIGAATPFKVNVRVVAATNSNVEQLVKDGRFREDLFYRLNVVRLRIPPLRERRDEIPALVGHFVAQSAAEFKKGDIRASEDIMEHLLLYRWPGNVRQLQNEMRRMVALAEPNSVLTSQQLSEEVFNTRLAPRPADDELEMVVPLKNKLVPTVSKIEHEMIRLALRDHRSNLDAAARALGISRKGLYLKRQRLGL
jgi:DNA-binding NtrC family response regulator/tetratricopeptide (TPR) repeat protein